MDSRISKRVKWGIQVVMWVTICSCVTPIELPTSYATRQIVISGQISTLADRNLVQVGITALSQRLPEPVPFAQVVLYSQSGEVVFYNEDPDKPGNYRLPDFAATPGETYHIEVTTQNGEVYQSAKETVPLSPGTISARYEMRGEEVIDKEGTIDRGMYTNIYANASFEDANTPRFVKWTAEEVYLIRPTNFPDPFGAVPPDCFVVQNADPQRIVIIDRNEVRGQTLDDIFVAARLVNQTFHYRHAFTVYQSAITENAYEYWRKVNIVANQNGSIFDAPPASVTGNIMNVRNPETQALGYFQASNQVFDRFTILKGELPIELAPYCDFDFNKPYNSYTRECLNCLLVPNSSYNRPDWF
jgi:hypothetical protein